MNKKRFQEQSRARRRKLRQDVQGNIKKRQRLYRYFTQENHQERT